MKKIFDVLIVGAGPAGLFAAFEAASADLSVCIVETLDIAGGQCSVLYPEKSIYDLPGHVKISGLELSKNLIKQLERFGALVEFVFNCEVCQCVKNEDNFFVLKFSQSSEEIFAKTVIVSSGGGSFVPNKPQTKNIEIFEECDRVHYLVKNSSVYENKVIAIAGGGDSAVDWALGLSGVALKIFFIHRRQSMRCHPSSLKQLYDIAQTKKIEFKIPYIAESLEVDFSEHFQSQKFSKKIKLVLKNFDKDEADEGAFEEIEIDYFLPFFGLKSEIGGVKNFGIDFDFRKKIIVDNHMRTNIDGIFASGDIVSYEGKTKLLVSCFHEASVAVNSVLEYLAKMHGRKMTSFSYSTTKFQ